MTGSLDEEQIRMISERAQYLRNLEERRQEILESITSQEKLPLNLKARSKLLSKCRSWKIFICLTVLKNVPGHR